MGAPTALHLASRARARAWRIREAGEEGEGRKGRSLGGVSLLAVLAVYNEFPRPIVSQLPVNKLPPSIFANCRFAQNEISQSGLLRGGLPPFRSHAHDAAAHVRAFHGYTVVRARARVCTKLAAAGDAPAAIFTIA